MSVQEEHRQRSRSSLRTAVLALVGVVVLIVVVAFLGTRDTAGTADVAGSGSDAVLLEDRPAPDEAFALPPATLEGFADGPPVALTDFRGSPLVVNFWATWCAPCVREMPEFKLAADELEGRVTFLGVDVEDAPVNAEPFVDELGIDYPLAVDPDGALYREVNNFGMPTTLLVDADGIVRYRHTGPLDRERLLQLLDEHLGVRAPAS